MPQAPPNNMLIILALPLSQGLGWKSNIIYATSTLFTVLVKNLQFNIMRTNPMTIT